MDICERLDWAAGAFRDLPRCISPDRLAGVLRDAKAEIERLRADYAAVVSLAADKEEEIETLRAEVEDWKDAMQHVEELLNHNK